MVTISDKLRAEGITEGRAEGMIKGLAEGMIKGKAELAQGLLKDCI